MWTWSEQLKGWSHASDDNPEFLSLGMVVIDELRFPNKETLFDVPGGSGLYATLGARLLRSATGPHSSSTACIVLAGRDFPEAVLQKLQGWQLNLQVHRLSNHPATRGLLVYEDDAFGKKSFVYTAPPLQPQPSHLESTRLLRAKSFHFLAAPEDLQRQVAALLELRRQHGISTRPLIVWEPGPLGCDRVHLQAHLQACQVVDVFSPNHLELGYLVEGRQVQRHPFDKADIEKSARQFLDLGIGTAARGLVVVRSGEFGVLTLSATAADWLPPFYDGPSSKVVDPTGAGNAFLGAFTTAFCESGDPKEASIFGSVAASFALEQFGVPQLSLGSHGSEELWNGTSVMARVNEFRDRISTRIDKS